MSYGDWESDAALAGTLYKKSKPYTALLIARCVEVGTGQGARQPRSEMTKVSLRTFSEYAEISHNTVKKYLDTWDVMADRGYVPDRTELEPGEDIDVPDMKVWTECYRIAHPPKPKTEKPADPLVEFDTDNKRIEQARSLIAFLPTDRVPEKYHGQVSRIQDSLARITMGDSPERNMLTACHAMTELVALLNEG